jgi:tetratricopeptide (TPR) repeat protein/predicted Ser/Thr protein kinase
MAIAIGTIVGPYKILAPLGAGGMGEVYRAFDARLGREIALKVLPVALSRDSALRARFEQEARAASALNHPNIVCIHDIGQDDQTPYIVSELVDGEPLRAIISRGPAAGRKVIEIGKQIADGLAAAHSAGVVHRDLKPENILITRDGRVKIIDFGLAKQLFQGAPGDTVAGTLTMPGVVMGTIGYMSPEQIRAQTVDSRSDIFSLGVILYEMAAGRSAFTGASGADVMSAILRENPPELRGADLSPGLVFIIRRCLEKDATLRFQSASDLAFAISSLSAIPAAAPEGKRAARSWLWLAWAAPALCIAGGAVYWMFSPRHATPTAAAPAAVALPPPVVEPAKPTPAPPEEKPVERVVAEAPAQPANAAPPEPAPTPPVSGERLNQAFERGQRLILERKYDEAVKSFDEAIRLKPQFPMAFAARGSALLAAKDMDRALADFNEAIRLKPDLQFAFVERGRLYNLQGEYQRAIQDFDEAIQLSPDNIKAFEGRAYAKQKLRDHKGAAADRRQAAHLRR